MRKSWEQRKKSNDFFEKWAWLLIIIGNVLFMAATLVAYLIWG